MAYTRELAITELGGKCASCGVASASVLKFHYKNRGQKLFPLARQMLWATDDQIKVELAKCELICLNCYAILPEDKPIKQE